MKEALEMGAPINYRDGEALLLAIQGDHLDLMRFLVEHGIEINAHYMPSILNSATMMGRLDIVQYLVEHGADVHVNGDAPVSNAAAQNRMDMVQYLLLHGANIRDQPYHSSAIVKASQNGHLDMVKYLIEHGGKIDYALHAAMFSRHFEIVDYIISLDYTYYAHHPRYADYVANHHFDWDNLYQQNQDRVNIIRDIRPDHTPFDPLWSYELMDYIYPHQITKVALKKRTNSPK